MKVTVLGLGKSGVSAARYLSSTGAEVLVSESTGSPDLAWQKDIQELKASGVQFEFGKHSDSAIQFAELIVASPGISPDSDVIKRATAVGKEIICDIELAYRETSIPFVAITGTNGKSTTTALISHILTTSGFSAPACGNFGVPVLDQLSSNHKFLVVEVSSFQLYYCQKFAPFIAAWLNFTPDHLEWHGSLNDYRDAKIKVFANQTREQYAVLNMDDATVAATRVKSQIFPFSASQNMNQAAQGAFIEGNHLAYRLDGNTKILCDSSELQIKGKHNIENALAAVSATVLCGLSAEQIEQGLKSFTALEHRLEYVGTMDGVAFYNDSKATNISSTLKALESFPGQKIVLIAGGRDKGTQLDEFVESVKQSASAAILLGEARKRFADALQQGGFNKFHFVESLEEAIILGRKLNCGPVVLSPACASYDMFKNYEERGRVFKDLVCREIRAVAS